jgi:SAM-dependent methyltransferase
MTELGDFANQAQAYAARPGYPPELVDRLLAHVGVRRGDRIADIGAGTGLFTQLLVGRGLLVDAVEPGAEMRRRAPDLPDVMWHPGTFEATGLADGSLRWAVAAQAFHWADPPRALPEMHRVLARGAAFTVLWNDRRTDDSPVLAETWARIHRAAPGFDEAYRDRDWGAILMSTGHFAGVEIDEAQHTVTMDRARYVDLWRSHNRLTIHAGAAVAALFDGLAAQVADLETVDVPYTTRAWTVTRSLNARV